MATEDVVRILDASGKEVVIIETAGAGQSEVEIMNIADTVVVIVAPGLGDDIQPIKAGLMEIGDIFVVNKADRENADKTVGDINSMLDMIPWEGKRRPPVIKTTATTGEGVRLLLEQILKHRECCEGRVLDAKRRRKIQAELIETIKGMVEESLLSDLKGKLEDLVDRILARELDPYSAAQKLLSDLRRRR